MRSAAIGIGTLFICIFTFIIMATLLQDCYLYQEANTACNEAIYQTEVFLNEEPGAVTSNDSLKNLFIKFLSPMLSHPEYYTVNFYGVNWEEGLLDVGVQYKWYPWISRHSSGE